MGVENVIAVTQSLQNGAPHPSIDPDLAALAQHLMILEESMGADK
jgi:hypothetical protein